MQVKIPFFGQRKAKKRLIHIINKSIIHSLWKMNMRKTQDFMPVRAKLYPVMPSVFHNVICKSGSKTRITQFA